MPRNFFHTALFSSVAAMLAMLATTAHGTAIVRARLDPFAVSGIPVPGYDGYADFEVFGTCLGTDGWKSVNSSGNCGTVAMYDSVIYLYGEDPGQGPGNSAHGDTMRFETGFGFSSAIFGIYVLGGEIKGIDMNPVSPYVAPDGAYGGRIFMLKLGTNCAFTTGLCSGFAPFGSLEDAEQDAGNGLPTDRITFTSGLPVSEPRASVFPGPTAVIPEPGTLSLLLGALGGAWLARRRSKPTH